MNNRKIQNNIASSSSASKAQQGFSLIEFMVSIVISMAVVIAASYVYLNSRETQRTLSEKSMMFESARFAMDLIGRDIENAGFYPVIRIENIPAGGRTTAQEYERPSSGAHAAFNNPVFGCNATVFSAAATSGCTTHSASTTGDTLVVNYYSNDEATLDTGQRADCTRADSADATENSSRKATGLLRPLKPLFVSNRYTLAPTVTTIEGKTINTFSLACNGNGANSTTYTPFVADIDQMRFAYMVRTGTRPNFQHQFLAAGSVTDWSRVVGVRVCLLARSLETSRLQGGTSYSINDCTGTSQSYSDGIQRRVFTQIYAIKSRLTDSVVP